MFLRTIDDIYSTMPSHDGLIIIALLYCITTMVVLKKYNIGFIILCTIPLVVARRTCVFSSRHARSCQCKAK